jgi:hypothetical protein
MELKRKVVMIISPQNWGEMHISKHHYAIELVKQGNTVYFLNLPCRKSPLFQMEEVPSYPGLFIINYYPLYRGKRVLPRSVFEGLMRLQVKFILFKIGQPIDVVWNFTSRLFYNLHCFGKTTLKIWHLVDFENSGNEKIAAQSADHIFAVSEKLKATLGVHAGRATVVNHGIARFQNRTIQPYLRPSQLTFCYVGNLQNAFVDRKNLLKLVEDNPQVQFHFIGPTSPKDNNLQGIFDRPYRNFLGKLERLPNCKLRGKVPSERLFHEIHAYDGFILMYDPVKLTNVGGNSHKIMEFLHTGKLIVSNFIDEYEGTGLFIMNQNKQHNGEMHALFGQAIRQIEMHNAIDKQKERLRFAANNTYAHHLEFISKRIY